MTPECFFASRNAGPCDGRLVRGHLIPRQLLKREGLGRLMWAEGVWVPMCGGSTGCSGHHGMFDTARTLRIARGELPPAVEAFAEEFGLTWWLDREYGPAREAA